MMLPFSEQMFTLPDVFESMVRLCHDVLQLIATSVLPIVSMYGTVYLLYTSLYHKHQSVHR